MCDLAVPGGILLCLPPAELGLEETALQSFLGKSEVLQPAGVFMDAQTGSQCRPALCSIGRSQLGFSKEFILFLRFFPTVLCCACRIPVLRKKQSCCARDVGEKWLFYFPNIIISLERLLRGVA